MGPGLGWGTECGVKAIERTSLMWTQPAWLLASDGWAIEPAWAASGGQLLTLLGATAPAGEEEPPSLLSALIHDPQTWRGALCCLPECVIGDPLPERLQEGDRVSRP